MATVKNMLFSLLFCHVILFHLGLNPTQKFIFILLIFDTKIKNRKKNSNQKQTLNR